MRAGGRWHIRARTGQNKAAGAWAANASRGEEGKEEERKEGGEEKQGGRG